MTSKDSPLVAIVVIHYGELDNTRSCLNSIGALIYPKRVALVIHNGTAPESLVLAQEYPDVLHKVVAVNGGYAAGVNHGIEAATRVGARFAYVLNNDTQLHPQALDSLIEICEKDPSVGIAGGLHYYYDRRNVIQNSGSQINWVTGAVRTIGEGTIDTMALPSLDEPDFLCGAGLFFPIETVRTVGTMDERYFMYCEDADWCFRIRAAGYHVVRVANSKLYHRGGDAVRQLPGLYQYFATRNKIWLVRRWAPRGRLWAYAFVHLFYFYPKMLLGCLLRGDRLSLFQTIRGIRDGLFSNEAMQ